MDAVTDSPGITANDIAAEMECNINYVYRLAKDLADKVEKRGKGFYPMGYVEGDEATEAPEDEAPVEDEAAEAQKQRPGAAKMDGRAVARMYGLIAEKPGISVPALARETGFTTMWIYRLIWDMKAAGLVHREKDGRTWRYTVTGAVKENAHVDA